MSGLGDFLHYSPETGELFSLVNKDVEYRESIPLVVGRFYQIIPPQRYDDILYLDGRVPTDDDVSLIRFVISYDFGSLLFVQYVNEDKSIIIRGNDYLWFEI